MPALRHLLLPCALAALIAGEGLAAQNTMAPAAPATRPAAPAPQRTTTFTMGGLSFGFPIPVGFCLPVGRYVARSQEVAAGDASNITNLAFNDCASMQRNGDLLRWGMIKTPRNLMYRDIGSRQSVIDELKRQFASGDFERQINEGLATSGNAGMNTAVRPLGTDAYGAYIGGTLSLEGRTFAAAWSMTAVKNRLLAVYIYGPYNGPADVTDVVNRVRTSTRQLVAANGG
jgi:hypothetical protein